MLSNLQTGQVINDKFGIISITEKTTTKGDPYWIVELTHNSGTVNGKVWSDSIPNVQIKEGAVALINARVEEYRGNKNFNIQQAKTVNDDEIENYISSTATMVFDIETVGQPYDELDDSQQDYFWNNLEKKFEGTDQQKKDRTGLYPLFAYVVAIGMYNPTSKRGMVYYLGDTAKKKDIKKIDKAIAQREKNNQGFKYLKFENEKELLEAFWESASKYERFVTYNGGGFDWPFLVFRSGIHRVKVPFEIKGSSGDRFIDLATKLRMNFRSFKLEQLCKAMGIENPKKEGVSGMEVARLYREGKLHEIVEYVGRDVVSTSDLYELWRTYLAGKIIV